MYEIYWKNPNIQYVEKFRDVCFKKACQKLARHTYTLTVLKGCSKEQFFRHRILRKFVSTLQVMCFLAFIQFSKPTRSRSRSRSQRNRICISCTLFSMCTLTFKEMAFYLKGQCHEIFDIFWLKRFDLGHIWTGKNSFTFFVFAKIFFCKVRKSSVCVVNDYADTRIFL